MTLQDMQDHRDALLRVRPGLSHVDTIGEYWIMTIELCTRLEAIEEAICELHELTANPND